MDFPLAGARRYKSDSRQDYDDRRCRFQGRPGYCGHRLGNSAYAILAEALSASGSLFHLWWRQTMTCLLLQACEVGFQLRQRAGETTLHAAPCTVEGGD